MNIDKLLRLTAAVLGVPLLTGSLLAQSPLVIQCPANTTNWICEGSFTTVTYPAPNVSNSCGSPSTVTCIPPSGGMFILGITTVNCTATNSCRQSAACNFTVAVNADTRPPTLRCPAFIVVESCTTNPVPVNYPVPPATDDHSATVTVVCMPPSGSLFPVGTTVVNCVAFDDCTNRSTCSFDITINADPTPPTIQCPGDRMLWTCGTNSVAVNYPAPMAADDQSLNVQVVCVPPSGSLFPPGVTIVTCTATDDCINSVSCSFQVRVAADVSPPVIVCPTNFVRYTCVSTGGPAIYFTPEATDNVDPDPEVVCTPDFGDWLPLGTNVITCVATDDCGNSNACSFTITMTLDTIPPVIICPGNIVVQTCDPKGVPVSWPDPEVTDNYVSNPTFTCTPHSGSLFPIGMTMVMCEGRDSCGNTSQCSFKVTVVPDAEIPGTDTDDDGLSDFWEALFNADGLAPNDDTDGDGLTNVQEAQAGTDPMDAASRLAIQSIDVPNTPGDEITIVLRPLARASTKLFQLQSATTVTGAWVNVGPLTPGSERGTVLRATRNDTNQAGGSTGWSEFYRSFVLDVDSDQDGLTAWEESILGTSDLSPNTQGNPGGDHGQAQNWLQENYMGPPRLREVALAHIGGSPNGPTQTKLVTATGTGGGLLLSSWTLDPGTFDPVHLQDTAPFDGWNAKLHVLEPPLSPTLSLNPFVSARIRQDSNVWLSVRRVDAAGAFSAFDTLGYGENAGLRVYEYAMAHRADLGTGGAVESFLLVTPVMGRTTGGQKQLRVVSWVINPMNGDINGVFDTGDLEHSNLPDDGGRLQIARKPGGRWVVSYLNQDSQLSSWFFEVSSQGVVIPRGGATSGVDLQGDAMAPVVSTDFALAELNGSGFVTALLGTNCTARLAVWEERQVPGGDPALQSLPYYITDNTLDLNPNGNGIQIPAPVLTDSQDGNGVTQKVRARLTDAQWEQSYGVGNGVLFSKFPPNEPISVHAASVTKCMTLLLTAEILALPGINAALGDLVTVSTNAANTGGSFMGDNNGNATVDAGERPLLPGDKLRLSLLLSGMMVPSCNKSSRAIAEYIGAKHSLLVEGQALTTDDAFAYFVGLMNDRADDLGMNNTQYSHPAHGGVTTPQDLVTLWREGWKHSVFRTYSSSTLVFFDCGFDAQGAQVCFGDNKGNPWYPGLEAWKGGNLGWSVPGFNVPFCTSCYLGQSTRLDRSLIVALQQTGSRSGDSARLWDYGYRQLFTPDYRGGGGINTPVVTDFAVRKIHDTLAVSAVIHGADQLRIDAWQVVAGIGQVGPINNSSLTINNLPAGNKPVRPTLIDLTKLPTVGQSEADYLSGHLDGGDLRLNVWRVAAEPGE